LLKDAGHEVYGIDRRQPPGHLQGVCDKFLFQDFASDVALSWIISKQPDAIIHCAGTSLVGPSMQDPSEYYNNNVAKTLKLLDVVRRSLPRCRFVFSSSAATYGEPILGSCNEVDPCLPVSPYGESKLMIDMILESYRRAYNLNYVSFRYFNACGADPQGRHGQEPGATHIIARVLESIRDKQDFVLNGNDFPTIDGTCVRDYVHVEDIARAHALALHHKIPAGVYNLGSNMGTTNLQIIEAAQDETQQTLNMVVGSRRAGDPPALTANPTKFNTVAGAWRHHDLDAMIQHAWAWYVRKNQTV
jgi:UDP-glucose 4-epimerase